MEILVLSKYSRIGSSSRLRLLQYIPLLQSKGFNLTVNSLLNDEYLQRLYENKPQSTTRIAGLFFRRFIIFLSCYKYDLIWIEKEIFPYVPAIAERMLTLFGKRYVVDYDDAVFHSYDRSEKPLIRWILGGKIDAVMRYSSCVVVGNNYLSDRATKAGAAMVQILPTVVDHMRYRIKNHSSNGSRTIGWVGSPSTEKYLLGIRIAIMNVCKSRNARLMLVGATPEIATQFPGVDVKVIPWAENDEVDHILSMDVGIMPLTEGPWERGKCGYKLIQYMACGVPVVASPVGANTEIVTASRSGLLAGSGQEWESALGELLDSQNKREKFGAAGREAVENRYSVQVQAPALANLFHSILD